MAKSTELNKKKGNIKYEKKKIFKFLFLMSLFITCLLTTEKQAKADEINVATGGAIELNSPMFLASAAAAHVHTADCYDGHRHTDGVCAPAGDITKLVRLTLVNSGDSNNSYSTVMVKCATCGSDLATFRYTQSYSTGYVSCEQYLYKKVNGVTTSKAYNYAGPIAALWLNRFKDYTYAHTETYHMPGQTTFAFKWEWENYPAQEWNPVAHEYTNVFEPYIGCTNCAPLGTYYSCGLTQDNKTECNIVVTSILPLNSNQTVYIGATIDTRATANFLDGSQGIVNCTSTFDTSVIGEGQTASLSYSGLIGNAKTTGNISCTVVINVIPNLKEIKVTSSSNIVFNGEKPSFSVTAIYEDGKTKELSEGEYSYTGWSDGFGEKTLEFIYSENEKTVSSIIIIKVKPNLTDLTVIPDMVTAYHGEDILFITQAKYEDGSTADVVALCNTAYDSNMIGNQEISYSYTENNITCNAFVNIVVLDYPVSIDVVLLQDWIYQGQNPIVQNVNAELASGSNIEITPITNNYDNITVGFVDITFSYSLNDRNVSISKNIEIKPDLYDITLGSDTLVIYKGQSLELSATANFNISGDLPLSLDKVTIDGFNNNIYNRTGTYYTLSFTSKGITISKQVFIRVLPNITSMMVSVPPQTTEGNHIPFSVVVKYEDGMDVTITDADVGGEGGSHLSISGYDINQVGYQDIVFQWIEGDRTLSESIRVRVRALINISIPLNMLISIDPNISGPGGVISPDITLNNASKEPVIISVQSIVPIGDNVLKDVLPTAHPDWTNLGRQKSKDIAIGLNCKNNWLISYHETPLYIAEITGETDMGKIDKESVGSIELLINHGNSHSERRNFTYNILWHIRLIE